MFCRLHTITFQGIDAKTIDVEVQISAGLPAFSIVGLADKAVAESRERIRSALHAIGLALPPKRITVNLAPADMQKEGSHYDLPIALGILACMDAVPRDVLGEYLILGELSLDGKINAVCGVLPAAIHASSLGLGLICPEATGGEAAWAADLDILAPGHVLALMNHLKGTQVLSPPEAQLQEDSVIKSLCLRDIKGQETAKRALEIAAAGGHNMLMLGPPGSGKSMLASRLPGILPPLSAKEALNVTMIHSLAGQLEEGHLVKTRPFRDPHHSASMPALVGGGMKAQPGEVSLAHHGVLFLDELPEFSRQTLEALRQPLETGKTLVSRANHHYTYPAQVQLVAAMNPCRCGYMADPERACSKAPKCGNDYQSKISGPLFDRIDIHVDVPEVSAMDLSQAGQGEPSDVVAQRVHKAREIQRIRYEDMQAEILLNAHADGEVLEKVTALNAECQALMHEAASRFKLSARGYHRILRVARTIADLEDAQQIQRPHLAEALGYRRLSF